MELDYQPGDGADDPRALLLRCRNRLAQDRLSEALDCYDRGLTNQCVVTTWQAVVLDYLAKLQDLENVGNEAAGKELRNYEGILRSNEVHKAIEFERGIIEKAHAKFGFIPGVNATDLKHLHDDRHRAAHPTMRGLDEPFKLPPAKALLHMQTAVGLMLSVPAYKEAGPVAELDTIISGPGFPTSVGGARECLIDSPLKDAGSGIVRELLQEQVEAALWGDEAEAVVIQRAVAIAALRTTHASEFEAFMPVILGGIASAHGWRPESLLTILWVTPALWQDLPSSARSVLARSVSEPLTSDNDARLLHAYRVPALQEAVLARAADLPEAQLQHVAGSSRRGEYAALIIAGILARNRPMLLVDTLHQWPDLIGALSVSEALEAASSIRLMGQAASSPLETMSTGSPKNFWDGVWRGVVLVGTVAEELLNYEMRARIRSVAAGIRARLAHLGNDQTLGTEGRAALRAAHDEMQQLEARLGPLGNRPEPRLA